jgi:hypothetical protein
VAGIRQGRDDDRRAALRATLNTSQESDNRLLIQL